MKVTSLRVYEGNNIKKVKRVMQICLENTTRSDIRRYLKVYFRISFLLGYRERFIDMTREAGTFKLWVTYTEEEVSRYLLSNISYNLESEELILAKAENLVKRDFISYLVNTAREKGVPVIELSEDLFQFGYCRNSVIIGRTYQSYENQAVVELSRNRKTLWERLMYSGLPKTDGRVLYSIEEIKDVSEFIYPINIRSIDKKNEVKITIGNQVELSRVLDNVMKMYTRAFVYSGEVKYRIICYRGEVKNLLKKENGYRCMEIENNSLEIIEVAEAIKKLQQFCSIIYKNFPIEFMYIDIQEENGFKVVDLGSVFDVAEEIKEAKEKIINSFIEALLKDGVGLIPIISITGTNGKTTTARLVYNILLKLGYKAALTSTGGIFAGGEKVRSGDTTGFLSARAVLSNKEVEIAVMETARGGIIKNGLGYEKSTAAIFTSISEDHIGMSGVRDLKDLLNIKSIILEEVKENGKVIVKAQEELVAYTKNKSKVCLYGVEMNQCLLKHIQKGGEALYFEDEYIVYCNHGERKKITNVKEIPFAHYGYSKSNILNIMASIAAILEINDDLTRIIEIIKTLKCDLYFNPGRQNILEIENFKVILDYGHNSESFKEVLSIAKSLKPVKLTGIITAPGDRMDKYIKELGAISTEFCDNIIIREQMDLRERQQGETAALLREGAVETGYDTKKIKTILKEEDSLLEAMNVAKQGEVIVLFTQCLDVIIPVINGFLKERGREPIGKGLDFSH